ncbi:MAG: enoyl-CoA hydratase/isomerase family protein, partial [Alphaproteobacteria bacterium]
MTDQPNETPAILFREEGRAGLITLNRQQALNALTRDMIQNLETHYIKWGSPGRIYGIVLEAAPGRAFCAGGDIRESAEVAKTDPAAAMPFFRDEYQHNWSLECFSKPNVALIDGLVMGGGVGISIFGTHRVAGENYSFAMPEVGIGFFTDVGASYVLARLPGEMGVFLGLTGRSIGRADGCYLGLVTHCVDANEFDTIRAAMIEGDPIDPVLDNLHRDPGESELAHLQPVVDRLFANPTVEEILANLDAEQGEHAAWAQETAAAIRQK